MQADLCGPKEACIRWGVHHFPNTTDDLCSSDNVFFSYHYCSSFFLLKMHCESQTEMHYHRIPAECFFFLFFCDISNQTTEFTVSCTDYRAVD